MRRSTISIRFRRSTFPRWTPLSCGPTSPYDTAEAPGTIVVDPAAHYLYLVGTGGMATRYGVGVGRSGFSWSGVASIGDKQVWPDWYPPKEMFARQPGLMDQMSELRSGIGMRGGPGNPLGARALYLWKDNKDTLFRIHGTFEPWTIGKSVSSGCIRMINQDAMHLYGRIDVGTQGCRAVVAETPATQHHRDAQEQLATAAGLAGPTMERARIATHQRATPHR